MSEKIKLEDDFETIMLKMSDGNPGAITVMMDIVDKGSSIDPECGFPLLHILALDGMDIRGSDIWILYKDVCHENLTLMLALLRAKQLGIVSETHVKAAIKNGGSPLDLMNDILKNVKLQLKEFDRENK